MFPVKDFLADTTIYENIATNPPFRHAVKIIEHGLAHVADGGRVATLVPVNFLASQGRYSLFSRPETDAVLVLSRRPSMPPGELLAVMGESAATPARWTSAGACSAVAERRGRRQSHGECHHDHRHHNCIRRYKHHHCIRRYNNRSRSDQFDLWVNGQRLRSFQSGAVSRSAGTARCSRCGSEQALKAITSRVGSAESSTSPRHLTRSRWIRSRYSIGHHKRCMATFVHQMMHHAQHHFSDDYGEASRPGYSQQAIRGRHVAIGLPDPQSG